MDFRVPHPFLWILLPTTLLVYLLPLEIHKRRLFNHLEGEGEVSGEDGWGLGDNRTFLTGLLR